MIKGLTNMIKGCFINDDLGVFSGLKIKVQKDMKWSGFPIIDIYPSDKLVKKLKRVKK